MSRAAAGGAATGDAAMRESLDLLETLTQADAVPGHEAEVVEIFRSRLSRIGAIGRDRLGSVFCTKRGTSDRPRVLVESHVDEVGFLVERVTERGFVKFVPLGGWWAHALLAQRVRILTRNGKVPGVIASPPPHRLQGAARDRVLDVSELLIDVGAADRREAEEHGIVPGCPIVPDSPFVPLKGGRRFATKAFDNRVGVALVIEALERLGDHPNTVIGAGSVQEEVGMRGARTMAAAVDPDVAIVLEGPYADDSPPGDPGSAQCAVGRGVHVRLYDPTIVCNPALADLVLAAARRHGIAHQPAVWTAGGTDAGRSTRRGAACR
jgi:endoglucanase